jgi:hypothetical protein
MYALYLSQDDANDTWCNCIVYARISQWPTSSCTTCTRRASLLQPALLQPALLQPALLQPALRLKARTRGIGLYTHLKICEFCWWDAAVAALPAKIAR